MPHPNFSDEQIRKKLMQAEKALQDFDWEQARNLYQAVLDADENHQLAQQGLQTAQKMQQAEIKVADLVTLGDRAFDAEEYRKAADRYTDAWNIAGQSGVIRHIAELEQKRSLALDLAGWGQKVTELTREQDTPLPEHRKTLREALQEIPSEELFAPFAAQLQAALQRLESKMGDEEHIKAAEEAYKAADFEQVVHQLQLVSAEAATRQDVQSLLQKALRFVERLRRAIEAPTSQLEQRNYRGVLESLDTIEKIWQCSPQWRALRLQAGLGLARTALKAGRDANGAGDYETAEREFENARREAGEVLKLFPEQDDASRYAAEADDLLNISRQEQDARQAWGRGDLVKANELLGTALNRLARARESKREYLSVQSDLERLKRRLDSELEARERDPRLLKEAQEQIGRKAWREAEGLYRQLTLSPLEEMRKDGEQGLERVRKSMVEFEGLLKRASKAASSLERVNLLEQAVELWPGDSRPYGPLERTLLDMAEEARGDTRRRDEVVGYLAKVLKYNPHNERALELKENLDIRSKVNAAIEQAGQQLTALEQAEEPLSIEKLDEIIEPLKALQSEIGKKGELHGLLKDMLDQVQNRRRQWQAYLKAHLLVEKQADSGEWLLAAEGLEKALEGFGDAVPAGQRTKLAAWQVHATRLVDLQNELQMTWSVLQEQYESILESEDYEGFRKSVEKVTHLVDSAKRALPKIPAHSADHPSRAEQLLKKVEVIQKLPKSVPQEALGVLEKVDWKNDRLLVSLHDEMLKRLETAIPELRIQIQNALKQNDLEMAHNALSQLAELGWDGEEFSARQTRQQDSTSEFYEEIRKAPNYKEISTILERHQVLLEQLSSESQDKGVVAQNADDFLHEISASTFILSLPEQRHLLSLLRFWGSIIYEQRKSYPNYPLPVIEIGDKSEKKNDQLSGMTEPKTLAVWRKELQTRRDVLNKVNVLERSVEDWLIKDQRFKAVDELQKALRLIDTAQASLLDQPINSITKILEYKIDPDSPSSLGKRENYEQADRYLSELKQSEDRDGILRIAGDLAERWLHLARREALQGSVTSGVALSAFGDAYRAASDLLKLEPGKKKYIDQMASVGQKLLNQLKESARNRIDHAQAAFKRSDYVTVTTYLQELENNFFRVYEKEFPELFDLDKEILPLRSQGQDLLAQVEKYQEVEKQIAPQLDEVEQLFLAGDLRQAEEKLQSVLRVEEIPASLQKRLDGLSNQVQRRIQEQERSKLRKSILEVGLKLAGVINAEGVRSLYEFMSELRLGTRLDDQDEVLSQFDTQLDKVKAAYDNFIQIENAERQAEQAWLNGTPADTLGLLDNALALAQNIEIRTRLETKRALVSKDIEQQSDQVQTLVPWKQGLPMVNYAKVRSEFERAQQVGFSGISSELITLVDAGVQVEGAREPGENLEKAMKQLEKAIKKLEPLCQQSDDNIKTQAERLLDEARFQLEEFQDLQNWQVDIRSAIIEAEQTLKKGNPTEAGEILDKKWKQIRQENKGGKIKLWQDTAEIKALWEQITVSMRLRNVYEEAEKKVSEGDLNQAAEDAKAALENAPQTDPYTEKLKSLMGRIDRTTSGELILVEMQTQARAGNFEKSDELLIEAAKLGVPQERQKKEQSWLADLRLKVAQQQARANRFKEAHKLLQDAQVGAETRQYENLLDEVIRRELEWKENALKPIRELEKKGQYREVYNELERLKRQLAWPEFTNDLEQEKKKLVDNWVMHDLAEIRGKLNQGQVMGIKERQALIEKLETLRRRQAASNDELMSDIAQLIQNQKELVLKAEFGTAKELIAAERWDAAREKLDSILKRTEELNLIELSWEVECVFADLDRQKQSLSVKNDLDRKELINKIKTVLNRQFALNDKIIEEIENVIGEQSKQIGQAKRSGDLPNATISSEKLQIIQALSETGQPKTSDDESLDSDSLMGLIPTNKEVSLPDQNQIIHPSSETDQSKTDDKSSVDTDNLMGFGPYAPDDDNQKL